MGPSLTFRYGRLVLILLKSAVITNVFRVAFVYDAETDGGQICLHPIPLILLLTKKRRHSLARPALAKHPPRYFHRLRMPSDLLSHSTTELFVRYKVMRWSHRSSQSISALGATEGNRQSLQYGKMDEYSCANSRYACSMACDRDLVQ